MPGVLKTWPAWPEFVKETEIYTKDPDFKRFKQEIIAQYGEEAIRSSWLKACRELEAITRELSHKEGSNIPSFELEHIINDGLSLSEVSKIKTCGCFIVRQVLSEAEAREQYHVLQRYVADNHAEVKGWPAETPSMLMLYDSPTQIAMRTHPNHLRVQRKLNAFWHDASGETSPEPLLYSDGIRDRPPQQPFLGLGPHIDAGSLSRWADSTYRSVYHNIFAGAPELQDCFDLGARKDADQYLFPAQAHSTVFRAFQGWTALTPSAPRAGTIMLYPHLKNTIAYVLLRPFFSPPEDEKDILDAEKWSFNSESSWFPGTFKEQSQLLSRSSHPHLRLEDCLVHAPSMRPGDSVWWHTDLIHAVDTEHIGSENAPAVFIAACPTTRTNQKYIKAQLEASLAGQPPPDYQIGAAPLNESAFKGYTGFANLNNEAKRALGFEV